MANAAMFLVFLLLIAPLLASQQDADGAHGVFRVPRIRNSAHTPNYILAKRKLFLKYGWPLPTKPSTATSILPLNHPSAHSLLTRTNSPSKKPYKVTANSRPYFSEYLCPVTIGHNQTLMMDFDTGSSDLWVFSTHLNSSDAANHTLFNQSASSTFRLLNGEKWAINYADGSSAGGIVGTDNVNVGGAVVQGMGVELATHVSTQFLNNAGCDGLMGFAFSRLNTARPTPQKTFFDRLRATLASPVMVADLTDDGTGFYQFGAVDMTKVQGALSDVPVNNSYGFWEFESKLFAVGGKTVQNPGGSPGIADTGTTLILVDPTVAFAYWKAVPSAAYSYQEQGYVFPCSEYVTLPTFGIGMAVSATTAANAKTSNKIVVTVPSAYMTYAAIDGYWCVGALQSNNGNPAQVFGDVMFRSAVVVFEWQPRSTDPGGFIGLKVGRKRAI